jgi:hypothetical protein
MLHRTPRRSQAPTDRYRSFLECLRGYFKGVTPEGAASAGPTIGVLLDPPQTGPRPPLHQWGIPPACLNPSSGRRLSPVTMPTCSQPLKNCPIPDPAACRSWRPIVDFGLPRTTIWCPRPCHHDHGGSDAVPVSDLLYGDSHRTQRLGNKEWKRLGWL